MDTFPPQASPDDQNNGDPQQTTAAISLQALLAKLSTLASRDDQKHDDSQQIDQVNTPQPKSTLRIYKARNAQIRR